LLDENVQIITGFKPSGPIEGIKEYKQVFSGSNDFHVIFEQQEADLIELYFAFVG